MKFRKLTPHKGPSLNGDYAVKFFNLASVCELNQGFGSLTDHFTHALGHGQGVAGLPAYHIEMLGDESYAICLEVPGYGAHELMVEVSAGLLKVRGKKRHKGDKKSFLKRLAPGSFTRYFELTANLEVKAINLNNGQLTIQLSKAVSETIRHREIPVSDREPMPEPVAETSKAA